MMNIKTALLRHGENIVDNDYDRLINWCFKYSSFFSLEEYLYPSCTYKIKKTISDLTPYLIMKSATEVYPKYNECVLDCMRVESLVMQPTYYYKCCDETKYYLMNNIRSIYDWSALDKPENITFYRLDGTCVLYSTTHESICGIVCCSEEEFNTFPKSEVWEFD